jgi:hypothetical protein
MSLFLKTMFVPTAIVKEELLLEETSTRQTGLVVARFSPQPAETASTLEATLVLT